MGTGMRFEGNGAMDGGDDDTRRDGEDTSRDGEDTSRGDDGEIEGRDDGVMSNNRRSYLSHVWKKESVT